MPDLLWSDYPNFRESEFRCKHSGKCAMRPEFMELLQQIRRAYGKPMIITSGFRDRSHPIEAKKKEPGEHSYGLAADISVQGEDAIKLLGIATAHGIKRIGVQQKGIVRYLHLGLGDRYGFPAALWSY